MSYKLQVGEMKADYLTDKEIWGHFNFIFSTKSRNSNNIQIYSYKIINRKSL